MNLALVACLDDHDVAFPRVEPDEVAAGGSSPSGGAGGMPFGIGGFPALPVGTAGASGNAASGPGGDPPEGDAGPVGIDAAPACDPCPCSAGPFGPPELVTGLSVAGNLFGPTFSSDALQLFFSSVEADENIFSAARADRSGAFAAATRVPNLDGGATDEGTPFLTFDGLSLYFFSTRPGPDVIGDRDLWVATRASRSAEFSAPAVVPAVNGVDIEHLPRLTRDELTLLFVSGRDSTNAGSNIWFAERASKSAEFGPASELPGVNTNAREEGFSLSSDGLTLYFASDRVTPLEMDIWVATRAELSEAFGPAESLEVINTTAQELDPALSPDGFELFFSSDRNGAVQLFRSVRICEP